MQIIFEVDGFDDIEQNLHLLSDNVVDDAVRFVAEDALEEVKEEMPRKSGDMVEGASMEQVGEAVYGVFNTQPYRWWVHEGTGIYGEHSHPIVPVEADFLRFEIDGEVIYAASVKGQESNPFYTRAKENVQERVTDHISRAVEQYVST